MAKKVILIQRYSSEGEAIATYRGLAEPEGLLQGAKFISPERIQISGGLTSYGKPFTEIKISGDIEGLTRIQIDDYQLPS